jgi:hypothetical protein
MVLACGRLDLMVVVINDSMHATIANRNGNRKAPEPQTVAGVRRSNDWKGGGGRRGAMNAAKASMPARQTRLNKPVAR